MGAPERNTAARRAKRHGGCHSKNPWRCAYCGEYFGKGRRSQLTIDHVIPKSMGGPNSSWNRVLACEPCNWNKRSKTFEEFTGLAELPAQCLPWFRTTAEFVAAQIAAASRASTSKRLLP